jgi:hypothetical protein
LVGDMEVLRKHLGVDKWQVHVRACARAHTHTEHTRARTHVRASAHTVLSSPWRERSHGVRAATAEPGACFCRGACSAPRCFAQVFGGSWGSTLALVYAELYPHRVTELVRPDRLGACVRARARSRRRVWLGRVCVCARVRAFVSVCAHACAFVCAPSIRFINQSSPPRTRVVGPRRITGYSRVLAGGCTTGYSRVLADGSTTGYSRVLAGGRAGG